MITLLLSGDGTVVEQAVTRAQLPLLLNQYVQFTGDEVDIAVETDTAFDATVFIGSALIPVDIAVETDTALNATVDMPPGVISLSVDVAVETSTAFDATVVSSLSGTFPGSAYPGTETYPWSGYYYEVDVAVETDTAFDATVVMRRLLPVSVRTGVSMTPITDEEENLVPVTPT